MRLTLAGLPGVLLAGLFATMPTSTNYSLKGYDVGGGSGTGSSGSYKLNATTGTQGSAAGTSYAINPGEGAIITSNVPPAPSLTNPNSYYDRLNMVVATGSNPSDAKYAIAISTNNFTTTQYVKADHSVAGSLVAGDYQTYATWGGAGGFQILGLQQNTTYTVKVKAMQGNFTESAYGPTASAATVAPSITFSLATTATSTPPFAVNFSNLAFGSVFNASADASMSLTTNALSGGKIYMRGTNGGLKSVGANYTLASATANLDATTGYGAIVTAATQTSGGPIAAVAPYNGASNNVGAVTTTLQEVGSTSTAVTSANLQVRFKAKSDSSVPSATDYGDVLTFVAAMAY